MKSNQISHPSFEDFNMFIERISGPPNQLH